MNLSTLFSQTRFRLGLKDESRGHCTLHKEEIALKIDVAERARALGISQD